MYNKGEKMSAEQNPEDRIESNGLDNWYGTPNKVGARDFLEGLMIIAVIIF